MSKSTNQDPEKIIQNCLNGHSKSTDPEKFKKLLIKEKKQFNVTHVIHKVRHRGQLF
jgi:hypothetical protein